MESGMLWFDSDSNSDLASKVLKAAAYYREKYGKEPNSCYVHPAMIAEENVNAAPITVLSNTTILPHHFWIGVQKQTNSNP